jgi:hypothetical protein
MKTKNIILALASLCIFTLIASAQEPPKGFTKGSIVLTDGSTVTGFIKEKIRSNASLTFFDAENKKKNYDGSVLQSANIGDEKFLCIKGDFFRIIEDGSIKFLQKSSDASSKPVYNGNQAIFMNGTEGDPGDYFLYLSSTRELKHLSRKTVSIVVAETFAKCELALAKAKAVKDDISKLNEAVQEYNHCGSVKN